MEQQPRRAARSYLLGALFVWALTGAVAITAFSGRSDSTDNSNAAAIKALSSESQTVSQTQLKPETAAPSNRVGKAGKIDWQPSFEAAMQRARAEKKPLMIDFYTDWCSWCKELDARVYPEKNVVSESANWISIRIDAEKRPDVAGAYGVTGYPTIVFAENTGKPIHVLAGFSPAPEFLQTMQIARAEWAKKG